MPSGITAYNATRQIEALISEYEEIVATLRRTLAILAAGYRRTQPGATLRGALALEAQRVAAKSGAPKPAKRKRLRKVNIRIQRKRSAAILAKFNRETPRPLSVLNGQGAAATGLFRHGYLVKRGDGYVRTDKEFSIDV